MRTLCLIAIAGLIAAGQTPERLTFDVASVKPVDVDFLQTTPKRSGGRISWTTDLWYLIGYAYRLPSNRMSGPIPGSTRIYQVNATTRPEATDDEVRRMFQSLLTERFKMEVRWVTKEADRYLLSVAKGGLKIRESAPDEAPSNLDGRAVGTIEAAGVGRIAASKCSMSTFTDTLQRLLGIFVVDKSELKGIYTFSLRYATDIGTADTELSPLLVVIQRELGLRLDKQRGPVEMLVVDRIDVEPTEN
jgi:uncharacterized protein (TIGR03435 family)